MRPAKKAWAILAVGVVTYELLARDGELLSHQVDRWLIDHPVITIAAIGLTAAHLLNFLPERVDPWVWMFAWRRFA